MARATAGANTNAAATASIDSSTRIAQHLELKTTLEMWINDAPREEVPVRQSAAERIEEKFVKREKSLHLEYKKLTSLPNCLKHLDSLERLYIHHNPIDTLPTLPPSLIALFASGCNLQKLPELPMHLRYMYIVDNQITTLPRLPDSILEIIVDTQEQIAAGDRLLNNEIVRQNAIAGMLNSAIGDLKSSAEASIQPSIDGCHIGQAKQDVEDENQRRIGLESQLDEVQQQLVLLKKLAGDKAFYG